MVEYEQATRDAWESDLLAYDRLLFLAATMLDVVVPPGVTEGEALTAAQRARLEEGLAGAGLQVQPGGPV